VHGAYLLPIRRAVTPGGMGARLVLRRGGVYKLMKVGKRP
ncbi:unnamed protein product, partial [Acidocella sp. C78]